MPTNSESPNDLPLGGSLFETFAATELRQADAEDDSGQFHHYRDRDQREVDLIIEHRDGNVIAIGVKAAASINPRDIRGLNYLRDKLGPRFIAGALLYTGPNTLPAGDRIAAIPLSGLWET